MTRRFQFSLRALLVATAVITIIAALQAERARSQREVVEFLLARDCDVHYRHQELVPGREWDHSDPSAPEWARQLLGDDYFRTPVTVFLGSSFTDDDFDTLARLKTIRSVEVYLPTNVTAEGLKRFKARLPSCSIPDLDSRP